jgi:hypothetical protein
MQKVSVHCIVFSGKSASLLHASVNSSSTIVQKECLLHFSYTTHRTELLFIVVFVSFLCSIVEKMLYATRAKSVMALATIFTSRAIIIRFLHLLHK